VLQCVEVCDVCDVRCSVLQCVAVCCVLQCVAVGCSTHMDNTSGDSWCPCLRALQCVAVSCIMSQRSTACCSVLQCVLVCRVLQCVAVRCSTHMDITSEDSWCPCLRTLEKRDAERRSTLVIFLKSQRHSHFVCLTVANSHLVRAILCVLQQAATPVYFYLDPCHDMRTATRTIHCNTLQHTATYCNT